MLGVCCTGVVTSFFLNKTVETGFNVTMSANSSEMVYGHFTGLTHSNMSTVAHLWHSNLYPNYRSVLTNQKRLFWSLTNQKIVISIPTTVRIVRTRGERLTSSLCLESCSLVSLVSWPGPTCQVATIR